MGRKTALAGVVALVMGLEACGSGGVSVERNYSPDTDFGRYATYEWSTESGELRGNPVIDEASDVRIRNAIDREMARAGFTRAAPGQTPHLTVGYLARVEALVQRRGDPNAADVDRYGGVYDSSPADRLFEEGALEVGIVDPRAHRVVWRGVARTELGAVSDAADRERRVDRVVAELFKGFPPG